MSSTSANAVLSSSRCVGNPPLVVLLGNGQHPPLFSLTFSSPHEIPSSGFTPSPPLVNNPPRLRFNSHLGESTRICFPYPRSACMAGEDEDVHGRQDPSTGAGIGVRDDNVLPSSTFSPTGLRSHRLPCFAIVKLADRAGLTHK